MGIVDPNTALEVIRQVIRQAIRYDRDLPAEDRIEVITEHFTALDEWLSTGGFLPAAWARERGD